MYLDKGNDKSCIGTHPPPVEDAAGAPEILRLADAAPSVSAGLRVYFEKEC